MVLTIGKSVVAQFFRRFILIASRDRKIVKTRNISPHVALRRGNRGAVTTDRGRLYVLPVFYITSND